MPKPLAAALASGEAATLLEHQRRKFKAQHQRPPGMELLLKLRALKDVPEVVTEARFAPGRKWRFDIAIPSRMLAIEIDGGVYTQGRHTRGKGFEADCIKELEAILLGWTVLRFTTKMVEDGRALDFIKRALA